MTPVSGAKPAEAKVSIKRHLVIWNLEIIGDGIELAVVICKRLSNQLGEHVSGGVAGFLEASISSMHMDNAKPYWYCLS